MTNQRDLDQLDDILSGEAADGEGLTRGQAGSSSEMRPPTFDYRNTMVAQVQPRQEEGQIGYNSFYNPNVATADHFLTGGGK